MAAYNLSAPEQQVVTTWLFEPGGYLDSAVNAAGQSARQALAATPTLDIYQWIRTNTRGAATDPDNWAQCGMVWWIRSRDGVNITPPLVPPEAAAWIATLTGWSTSISNAFAAVPAGQRGSPIPLYGADGAPAGTTPQSAHLIAQQNLIGKVVAVIS